MIDLSSAYRRVIDVLAGITDGRLAGATPCDDFTVADLLGHVNASAIRIGAAGHGVAGAHRLAGLHRRRDRADQRGVGPDLAHRAADLRRGGRRRRRRRLPTTSPGSSGCQLTVRGICQERIRETSSSKVKGLNTRNHQNHTCS